MTFDDLSIKNISPEPHLSRGNVQPRQEQGKKRQHQPREEAKDHFRELTEAAERAHRQLEEKNIPYRFCVYAEEGEVFIDVVALGPDGSVIEIKKKNITHQEFSLWLQRIELGEGFIFDDLR